LLNNITLLQPGNDLLSQSDLWLSASHATNLRQQNAVAHARRGVSQRRAALLSKRTRCARRRALSNARAATIPLTS
jgi:hypothetical protein